MRRVSIAAGLVAFCLFFGLLAHLGMRWLESIGLDWIVFACAVIFVCVLAWKIAGMEPPHE